MLFALTVAVAAVLLLLKRVTHTVVKSTRLLLGYCRHYLIESTADGAGTAMQVISQIRFPRSLYDSVLLATFLGLLALACALYQWRRLSRTRAHRARAVVVPSHRSAGEPDPGHPQDNAQDTDTASTLTSGTGFLEDDNLLSSEHTTPTPGHLSANIGMEFTDLLAACGQESFVTFEQLFNSIVSREEDEFEKIAEGKNSEVFRIHCYTGDSVLKVVKLGSTQESQHRLLTEIKIASRLTALRQRLDFFTKGFVELKSVTCVFDSFPEELLEARERAARTLPDERRDGNESVRTPRAYLAWHMSYGGVPLDQLKLNSTVQIWSILHQVALSLAVAEEALEFEHRALLLRRVLVKYTLEETTRFTIRGRHYLIETRFLEACILGGALARLSDGDTPVFTVIKDDSHEPMERHLLNVDVNMKLVIRNDWRTFHPLTNRLWLHYVTKELRWLYKLRFGSDMNGFETLFWSDIGSWKQKLFKYSSLAEFVENLPHVRAQRRHGA